MNLKNISLQIPLLVCAALLGLAAIVHFPNEYYHILRIAVFCTSIYAALYALQISKSLWVLPLAATAFVYNPIVRIHFSRGIWDVLDIVAIIVFVLSIFVLNRD